MAPSATCPLPSLGLTSPRGGNTRQKNNLEGPEEGPAPGRLGFPPPGLRPRAHSAPSGPFPPHQPVPLIPGSAPSRPSSWTSTSCSAPCTSSRVFSESQLHRQRLRSVSMPPVGLCFRKGEVPQPSPVSLGFSTLIGDFTMDATPPRLSSN